MKNLIDYRFMKNYKYNKLLTVKSIMHIVKTPSPYCVCKSVKVHCWPICTPVYNFG